MWDYIGIFEDIQPMNGEPTGRKMENYMDAELAYLSLRSRVSKKLPHHFGVPDIRNVLLGTYCFKVYN